MEENKNKVSESKLDEVSGGTVEREAEIKTAAAKAECPEKFLLPQKPRKNPLPKERSRRLAIILDDSIINEPPKNL